MEFRTKVRIEPFPRKISHLDTGLSLGSCFAGNIAARLQKAKFRIADNPFGVLFNPVSISKGLDMLSRQHRLTCNDLVANDNVWCSFDFHGSFASVSKEDALKKMNQAIETGAQALTETGYVIITFGSAWVYELAAEEGRVVANCHKFPSSHFCRRRLTPDLIVAEFSRHIESTLKDKQIIFTVSPVRHIQDGFPENTLSKAILVASVHQLVDKYENAHYFPAFEIMNDELRDYRFYAGDMLHPSTAAVDYIWERFGDAAFSKDTQELIAKLEKVASAIDHRPFNPDSDGHKRFLAQMLDLTNNLAAKHPEINLAAETGYFSR